MGEVYCATNRENGKQYIGKTTKSMFVRKTYHEVSALRGGKWYFQRALRKYGVGSFDWEVIFESDLESVLNAVERYFIKHLKTKSPYGYNMTDGGDGGGWYEVV